ncbi:MAG: hypothetical protein WCS37_10255 [Chloroflexota bacterium]|nr:hypothetical protein [Chloroflexota bacterium]
MARPAERPAERPADMQYNPTPIFRVLVGGPTGNLSRLAVIRIVKLKPSILNLALAT